MTADRAGDGSRDAPGDRAVAVPTENELASARRQMVARQIEARGVRDSRVLDAMRSVPRHRFVPDDLRLHAYDDCPLPIGAGQTISQPYVVAAMSEALEPQPGDVVLEIGTGCGYQTAVLARLVSRVYSIEIVPALAARARATLDALGVGNVEIGVGDGWLGLPEHAPYDGILVAAAAERVPEALLAQLARGGRLVLPVDTGDHQELRLVRRTNGGFSSEPFMDVRFVPLVHGPADG